MKPRLREQGLKFGTERLKTFTTRRTFGEEKRWYRRNNLLEATETASQDMNIAQASQNLIHILQHARRKENSCF